MVVVGFWGEFQACLEFVLEQVFLVGEFAIKAEEALFVGAQRLAQRLG
jgi:hypothetical protein